MGIEVRRRAFRRREEVLEDLRKTGFWPTTLVSGPSPGREVHWHAHDVHAYLVEGHTSFLDGESGERHPVGPGDAVIVPARALHAEGEITDRVVYIIATPEALPWDEFLATHEPGELEAPGGAAHDGD